MVEELTLFFRGHVVLTSLYSDMHQVVYCDACSIRARMTLLHIYAYKHISLLRPTITLVEGDLDVPMVYRYCGEATCHLTGIVGFPYFH
jgi:hypothetical protein